MEITLNRFLFVSHSYVTCPFINIEIDIKVGIGHASRTNILSRFSTTYYLLLTRRSVKFEALRADFSHPLPRNRVFRIFHTVDENVLLIVYFIGLATK